MQDYKKNVLFFRQCFVFILYKFVQVTGLIENKESFVLYSISPYPLIQPASRNIILLKSMTIFRSYIFVIDLKINSEVRSPDITHSFKQCARRFRGRGVRPKRAFHTFLIFLHVFFRALVGGAHYLYGPLLDALTFICVVGYFSLQDTNAFTNILRLLKF